jgi:hypothetical protein
MSAFSILTPSALVSDMSLTLHGWQEEKDWGDWFRTYAAIAKGMVSVREKPFFKSVPFCETCRCHNISAEAVPEFAST